MKKTIVLFMVLIITFSFSSCLKDDYENLQEKIEDTEELIDDTKDDIDDLKAEYDKLVIENEDLEAERDELIKLSKELSGKKTLLEDKIKETSDDGLKITAIQFSYGFTGYNINSKRMGMDLYDPPIMDIDDGLLSFTYLCCKDHEILPGLYYILRMSSDNLHVESIYLVAEMSTYEEYPNLVLSYGESLAGGFAMAREDKMLKPIEDTYNFNLLSKGEPAYNNTVILEANKTDKYIIFTISDIS